MNEHLGQLTLLDPRARTTDPESSHLAAARVQRGNAELVKAIRSYCWTYGPSTAHEIADALEGRWAHDTIRSACARAGLAKYPGGVTPRGNACVFYALQAEAVTVEAERL